MAVSVNDLFAGCGDGVFRSTDYGENWFAANSGLPSDQIVALVISGSNVFAGFENTGVFRSTNNGMSWSAVNNGLPLDALHALAAEGTNLFASTFDHPQPPGGGSIFLTTNNGMNWIEVSTGLTITDIVCFAASENYLFAGGGESIRNRGTGVWRRPLSEMITEIEDIEQMPNEFLLSQNYPNPFNPTTKITYAFPLLGGDERGGFVTLKVYDILGNEIETLVNEEKSPGTYEVTWNTANLPSGVYFYQLRAGTFIQTKKMVLLR